MTDTPEHCPDELLHAWSLTPHTRIWIGGHHLDAKRRLARLFNELQRPATGPLDAAVIAADTVDEALYFANKLKSRLTPDAIVWVVAQRADANDSSSSVNDPELIDGMSLAGYCEAGTRTANNLKGHAFRLR